MIAGWALLCLPLSQTKDIAALDNLFIAASAVSTTGLATIDPGTHYSFLGELVILLLIQLGGIGYMTFGSFVVLALRNRMSGMRGRMTRTVFTLPDDFSSVRFIQRVVYFTLICELVGAALLYPIFLYHNVDNALWSAIFHSISAFCTAGFSLNSTSFEAFATNPYLNIVIACLSYAGAIGFIVMIDLWERAKGTRNHLHFTSTVILRVTLWFSIIGTVLFFLIEPSVQTREPAERLLVSFFQVMSAGTTVGFNTIPIGSISAAVIMLLYLLMIFGASPSGTGGGLKSTSLGVLLGLINSTLKRRDGIYFCGHRIAPDKVQVAAAAFAYYMCVLFSAVMLLLITEKAEFEAVLFEAISALGTVGLSMGITGTMSDTGKCLIILLMFMGRVGILTFGIALSTRDESQEETNDNSIVL